jgi:cytochrome c oxidase subunit 2
MRRALALLPLLCAACGGKRAMLAPAGPQAAHIRDLWDLFVSVNVVVLVLVVLATLLAIVLRRGGREVKEGAPSVEAQALPPEGLRGRPDVRAVDPATERRMAWIVGGATLATVLTLGVLAVANTLTGRALTAIRSPQALEVEVVGHQFWWEFRINDADPSRTVVTANELHLPVGRPVLLKLVSRDVIHSFWVPEVAGKRDLIPGQQNTLELQVDEPGMYRGQCYEFCGHQHAKMGFVLVAEPPEQFEAWRARELRPAPPPSTPLAQRGQQVFLTGPCALCHTVQGTDARATTGPNLTHVASRSMLAAGTLPFNRGHLAGWIANPQALKPGNKMPPISLPPDDLQALLSYLEGLK